MTTDTERLDWLEKHRAMLNHSDDGPHVCVKGGSAFVHFYGASYREAIDEAIKSYIPAAKAEWHRTPVTEKVMFYFADFRDIHRRLRPEINDEEFKQLWDEYQRALHEMRPIRWDFEKVPQRESVAFYREEWREIFRKLRPDVDDADFDQLWADFQMTKRNGQQKRWETA